MEYSGDSPTSQRSLASTPSSSRPASRRGSRCEDTKNRLFGPAESSPRKVKNLFASKVFDQVDSATPKVTKIAATKAAATFTRKYCKLMYRLFTTKSTHLSLFLVLCEVVLNLDSHRDKLKQMKINSLTKYHLIFYLFSYSS